MSDLPDNQFYPSAERIWLCIRCAKWACNRLTENADFGKNIIFSDKAHFDLGGYVNKQNCRIWGTENPKKIEEEDIGNIWFQQDGAPCHTVEATLYVLRPLF